MRTISISRVVRIFRTSASASSRCSIRSTARPIDSFSSHCSPAATFLTQSTISRGGMLLSRMPGRRSESHRAFRHPSSVRSTESTAGVHRAFAGGARLRTSPDLASVCQTRGSAAGSRSTIGMISSPVRQRATTSIPGSDRKSSSSASRTSGRSSAIASRITSSLLIRAGGSATGFEELCRLRRIPRGALRRARRWRARTPREPRSCASDRQHHNCRGKRKPVPLSAITMSSSCALLTRSTRHREAPACRATLTIASCMSQDVWCANPAGTSAMPATVRTDRFSPNDRGRAWPTHAAGEPDRCRNDSSMLVSRRSSAMCARSSSWASETARA